MCPNTILESENPKKEISFYINSPGGIVWSGLAIYDTMQYVSSKIMTICIGQAASAGSLLLTAGEKDMRFSTKFEDYGSSAKWRISRTSN